MCAKTYFKQKTRSIYVYNSGAIFIIVYNIDILSNNTVYCYVTSSNRYKQSTPNDIWTKLEYDETLNKHMYDIYSSEINIKHVITSWTTEIGYPVVQVKRHNETQSMTIMVTDCFVFHEKELCKRKWWIPMTYLKIQNDTKFIQTFLTPSENLHWIPNFTENDFIIIVRHTGNIVTHKHSLCFVLILHCIIYTRRF